MTGRISELAMEFGVSGPEMLDACRTLGIDVSPDGALDEAAFRRAVAARRAARSAKAPRAAAEPVPSSVITHVEEDRAVRATATPALFAGAALVAAFFMPLVSGFGGLLTLSPWSYVRLAFDVGQDISVQDWIVIGLLPVAALLGLAVVVAEARARRNRVLMALASIVPFGLAIYVAIKVGSFDDFRHADIAGYVALAAAVVLLVTAIGAFDRGPRELRGTVYAFCGLLIIAGIVVPATGSSLSSDINQLAKGFESSFDAFEEAGDNTIDRSTLSVALAEQIAEEYGLDDEPMVNCPDEIAREVGASTTCTFETVDSDDEYDVEVSVSSVDGDDVEYNVVVASEPN